MTNGAASEVITQLRKFRDDIDAISLRVCGKTSVSRDEKEQLQFALKLLKLELKEAAKRPAGNQWEVAYFGPAVRKAAANFRIATNSHPIKSSWCGALFSVRMDITYYLSQLEDQFSKL